MGNTQECLSTLIRNDKFGQAAMFAKTYCPSKISYVVEKWKGHLTKIGNKSLANRLLDPLMLENNFQELQFLIKVESIVERFFNSQDIHAANGRNFKEELEKIDYYRIAKNDGLSVLEARL